MKQDPSTTQRKKAYRAERPDMVKTWDRKYYEANRESILATKRAYRQNNPDKINAKTAKRRANLKAAMPDDADQPAIISFYEMANRLTRIAGTTYHVDHITALANGGLHHQGNLVVMRADWNIKKGASDWPWLSWFNAPEPDDEDGGE